MVCWDTQDPLCFEKCGHVDCGSMMITHTGTADDCSPQPFAATCSWHRMTEQLHLWPESLPGIDGVFVQETYTPGLPGE